MSNTKNDIEIVKTSYSFHEKLIIRTPSFGFTKTIDLQQIKEIINNQYFLAAIYNATPMPKKIDLIYLNSIIEIACLSEFIGKLPYGLETKIGHNGTGLSAGQKQRILIARALYKDPDILIFDEATNALDSINEKNIIQNIRIVYPNKTIIVIAHRLSTIKYADKIIVLDKGAINNQGNHEYLVNNSALYKNLIISQT